ncbi:hypothetical protein [Bifidobacterium xylocopae]|uniref:Transposase n=1 Tax=Bifidobacterium xylocopae TaxID=2493119 RepID=A0A366KFF0_9BIFI|nr:hypothetical protein [Bifidobacterium xylocopae]RBP99982.1 hypothetical protein CRD59_00500 [Bifidobacterium xylocopae]
MADLAADAGASRWTLARCMSWCWDLEPALPPVLDRHHSLTFDGTYLAHGWCLLVLADARSRPLAVHWCDSESRASYRALFHGMPAPDALTCDGDRGCLAQVKVSWPGTRAQHCLAQRLTRVRDPQGAAS